MIKIHNVETGEVIEREPTADELAQLQADQVFAESLVAELKVKQVARQTLLDKLGITEEEAKLLLS